MKWRGWVIELAEFVVGTLIVGGAVFLLFL